MPETSDSYQKLGYFSETVAADRKRKEYDIRNHSIVRAGRRPDFLFIGDSITQYWELSAYFDEPGLLLINRGIEGDTTTYLNKRFQVDALQLMPKYCIMGIGINDTINLEGDYWKLIPPLPYEEVLCTARTNIKEIIRKAKNISQKDFIARLQVAGLDINPTSYSKLEGQVRIATDKEINIIAKVLNVPLEEIFNEINDIH